MNLDDVTLLRGWAHGLAWEALDDQAPEGSVPAKQRVKTLREGLASKARYYGLSETLGRWLGERHSTDAWQRGFLNALDRLTSQPDPVPALADAVDQWFDGPLLRALPEPMKTLTDVVAWLEGTLAGDSELPEGLGPELKKLLGFFDHHALHLGYQLNRKRKPALLPVPLGQVAPLERVSVPAALNGAQGSNRAAEPCRIEADHDLDAITCWLSLKDDNAKTRSAYKKELERLVLWAVLERGKAVSSLNTTDCKAYVHFLKTLDASNRQWVALEPPIKSRGTWKPFYYRAKANGPTVDSQGSPSPQPVLSPRSVGYAKTVISSCMDWLVKQNYLKHNNFDSIQTTKFAQTTPQTQNRSFTHAQMQGVFSYAESQVQEGQPAFAQNRRTLFVLKFAFHTGLRIHELAAARFGDIECLEDETGEHYFLKVIGKNTQARKTSLPQVFIEELKAYLRGRGLPTHFDFLPHEAPLIPSLRDSTGRKHLTPGGIHHILSGFFGQMYDHLTAADDPNQRRLANKLQKASTHWLRHSYGSYLANDRQVPLAYIRDELGHANISTTSLYLDTDVKERQRVVSAAFTDK
ncbi:site-specific integrase [Methylicorpusculum sp.]|uniref:tyrosine-type recombinase/integrase n=1 Tax=Methylicorpusculum sp. TaxID=2713644 RepID=UPI0027177464|nr:site-specific integrase [Methylicorpusculum sp.]MDO8845251.1 site-specific integrase [Methylicorpusculum sp.]